MTDVYFALFETGRKLKRVLQLSAIRDSRHQSIASGGRLIRNTNCTLKTAPDPVDDGHCKAVAQSRVAGRVGQQQIPRIASRLPSGFSEILGYAVSFVRRDRDGRISGREPLQRLMLPRREPTHFELASTIGGDEGYRL